MWTWNVVASFRHKVDEKFVLLGHYTESSGNSLLIFQDNQIDPIFKKYQSVVLSFENVITYGKI